MAYYRYHPLLLNAALLGGLDTEDYRILGFGDKTNYKPDFARPPAYPTTQRVLEARARGTAVRGRLVEPHVWPHRTAAAPLTRKRRISLLNRRP